MIKLATLMQINPLLLQNKTLITRVRVRRIYQHRMVLIIPDTFRGPIVIMMVSLMLENVPIHQQRHQAQKLITQNLLLRKIL